MCAPFKPAYSEIRERGGELCLASLVPKWGSQWKGVWLVPQELWSRHYMGNGLLPLGLRKPGMELLQLVREGRPCKLCRWSCKHHQASQSQIWVSGGKVIAEKVLQVKAEKRRPMSERMGKVLMLWPSGTTHFARRGFYSNKISLLDTNWKEHECYHANECNQQPHINKDPPQRRQLFLLLPNPPQPLQTGGAYSSLELAAV